MEGSEDGRFFSPDLLFLLLGDGDLLLDILEVLLFLSDVLFDMIRPGSPNVWYLPIP